MKKVTDIFSSLKRKRCGWDDGYINSRLYEITSKAIEKSIRCKRMHEKCKRTNEQRMKERGYIMTRDEIEEYVQKEIKNRLKEYNEKLDLVKDLKETRDSIIELVNRMYKNSESLYDALPVTATSLEILGASFDLQSSGECKSRIEKIFKELIDKYNKLDGND